MQFFGCFTNHRIWRAFTLTQFVKQRQLIGGNSQHVAFLGFVTPDFQRTHPRFVAKNIAQFEFTATPAVTHQFRHSVRKTTCTNVMDKQDWVCIAQLPAAVDHFLATTFHFGVVALYRSEIEVGIRLTGSHRRRCSAAKTDVHCRTTEDDELSTNVDFAFLHMIGADVADPARQHDRLVITTQLFAIVAVHFFFISTEVTVQCRTAKFVVKRRAAQRAFGHNVQCGNNTFRFTKIFFPRLFKAWNTQVGNGESNQAGFRLRAASGCAFITDFTTGTGRRTRPRRNCRRMVVGFHFHQDVSRFLMIIVAPRFMVGKIAAYFGTFHHGGVIFICRENVIWCGFEGVFNHLEQRFWLLFTVDNPVGVKNLVTAVLRVRLGEHIKLDVVRVTTKLCESVLQIVNLIFCQCQAKTQVSVDQGLTTLSQQINAGNRSRLMMSKQLFCII